MSQSKLQINLREGLVSAEGDTAFVTQVYNDFRDLLLKQAEELPLDQPPENTARREGASQTRTRKARRTVAKRSAGDADAPSVSKYQPLRDNNIDLVKLKGFLAPFDPANNAEKVVLYVKFLNDELKIEPVHANQIFSCFLEAKEKIPSPFGQVLIDTRGNRYGYIAFTGVNDVKLTTNGLNAFNFNIAKKGGGERE